MNHLFRSSTVLRVPDGTLVRPLLNPVESTEGLAERLGVSIAAGSVEPHSASRIHVHPHVSQVTYVVSGQLTIRMHDDSTSDPYEVRLASGDASLALPGTLLQLVNAGSDEVRVLYIVSPAYLFEMDEKGRVRYDDAVMLADTWDDLRASHWTWSPPPYAIDASARLAAAARLRARHESRGRTKD